MSLLRASRGLYGGLTATGVASVGFYGYDPSDLTYAPVPNLFGSLVAVGAHSATLTGISGAASLNATGAHSATLTRR